MIVLQIDVGYACGGVIVDEGTVSECAPIFRRALFGKTLDYVEWWVTVKGGTVEAVARENRKP